MAYLVITVSHRPYSPERMQNFGVYQHILTPVVVISYEVVLSNATIVAANADTNPDLFWALKGGGNQFGENFESLC